MTSHSGALFDGAPLSFSHRPISRTKAAARSAVPSRNAVRYEKCFHDLHEAVDDVQAHLQAWAEKGEHTDAICRLKLAVHEWMGNLVRHARFGERTPEVHVRVWRRGARLHCAVEDNSDGFDFDAQLELQRDLVAPNHDLPDGGMGLILLKASTRDAQYVPLEEGRNRLELSVSTETDASDGDDLAFLTEPPAPGAPHSAERDD